jgi:two-component system, cell cycle sensor histidine kinase and response regulator CckA
MVQNRIADHDQVAATELRESEERFRSAFEHTNVAMVMTDLAHRFIRVNAAFARLFGYSEHELLQKSMLDITHPDDIADSVARRAHLIAGDATYFQMEKRYLHKDGSLIWGLANVALVRDAHGEPVQYVGQVQDITERKRAEEALQLSETRYRSVIEGSLQGILIKQGPRIEYANPACLRMFGYASADQFVGRPWEMIVAPEERPLLWQRADDCVRGAPVAPHPGWQGLRKDGTRVWLESMISPVSWQGGTAVLVFLVDVSERKVLEEQFRQAQKMEAVGRLAGGIAHDFNNLLTVIFGFTGILLDRCGKNDPARELLQEVFTAGERAALLTRQLLAFSRKQVLQPTVLDVGALLGNMEKMLRRLIGEDIDLKIRAGADLWRVRADAGQLEQVVMNLVLNARDAMPTGGMLTIELANVVLDKTYVDAHPEAQAGEHVLLGITDTGCGMDAAIRSRIFEPFFTTKGPEQGTGLGLATVFGIVKQSRGHVEAYSELGVGSVFKVYLPRERDSVRSATVAADVHVPRQGTETLLLAEDEDGVRALARMVLAENGYIVLEARNGAEALRICDQHPGKIHLLLTDVVMPNMSGRQLAERMRTRRPETKVLYLSGYTDDAIVRHGVLQADVPFLQKPYTPSALAQKVREVLDRHADH